MRHSGTAAGGQNFCLDFDFAVTDTNVGRLAVQYYWLNEKNGWEYEKVWESDGQPSVGKWQVGQIMLPDKKGPWTVRFTQSPVANKSYTKDASGNGRVEKKFGQSVIGDWNVDSVGMARVIEWVAGWFLSGF